MKIEVLDLKILFDEIVVELRLSVCKLRELECL